VRVLADTSEEVRSLSELLDGSISVGTKIVKDLKAGSLSVTQYSPKSSSREKKTYNTQYNDDAIFQFSGVALGADNDALILCNSLGVGTRTHRRHRNPSRSLCQLCKRYRILLSLPYFRARLWLRETILELYRIAERRKLN
jgi:hypothetical protein